MHGPTLRSARTITFAFGQKTRDDHCRRSTRLTRLPALRRAARARRRSLAVRRLFGRLPAHRRPAMVVRRTERRTRRVERPAAFLVAKTRARTPANRRFAVERHAPT